MADLQNLLKKQAEKEPSEETETKTEAVKAEVVEETPDEVVSTELIEKDAAQSQLVLATAGVGDLGGEIDGSDLILPKIIQVHNVGDLAEKYDPGSAIFGAGGDTFPFVGPAEPFEFIPLKMQKVWREYFDYNDKAMRDEIPREFTSAKEMVENGGRESYDPHPAGKGHFRPALSMMVAVICPESEVPEDLVPFYCDRYEDDALCLAMWRLQKSGYSSAGKVLITDAQRALRKTGILSARYTAKFEKQKRGDNSVWCPIVSLNRTRNSPELIAFLKELVSG